MPQEPTIELTQLLTRLVEILAPKAAPTDPDEWLRLDACPVPYRQALSAIKAGELRASRVGRQYLIRRGDLDRWLESCRVKPDTAGPAQITPEQPSLGARVLELGGRRR